MKKILVPLCVVILFAGIFFTWMRISQSEEEYELEAPLPFRDVLEGDWYYEYVSTAYDKGWLKGTSDETFSPEQTLSRGDFAMVLYRYLGTPSVVGLDNPFVDVPRAEHAHAVMHLRKIEIMNGKDSTHFAPDEPISREAAVTVLYRWRGSKVDEVISPAGKFMDWNRASEWARDALDWAVTCGFLEGTTSSILSPQAPITRAQFAKVLCLFDEKTNKAHSDSKVTLEIWQAGVDDTETTRIMRQLLNRFEKRYPDITVEYTPLPSNEQPYEMIARAMENGKTPDVLIVNAPYEKLLADRGQVLPLDSFMEKEILSDIHAGLLLDCYYDSDENSELRSRLVSVPFTASPAALLMNKELLNYFGLSAPTGDYSYKRLLSDARTLTGPYDGQLVYGYGVRASAPGQYLSLLWDHEQYLVEPRSRTAGTNTAQWKQYSEEYLALYKEKITPDYKGKVDYYSMISMFGNGKVSMLSASEKVAELFRTRDEWKDKLVVYPYTDSQGNRELCVGQVAMICADTENMVQAGRLLNFLLQSDTQSAYSEKSGELPAAMSALDINELKDDPRYQPFIHGLEDTKRLGDKGLEAYKLLREKLQAYVCGEMDTETYCRTLTEELDRLLGNKTE